MSHTAHTLVSVAKAAEILAVHPATIRRMIARGELSAKRVGRVWRVDPVDLEPEPRTLSGSATSLGKVTATISPPSLSARLLRVRKGSRAS